MTFDSRIRLTPLVRCPRPSNKVVPHPKHSRTGGRQVGRGPRKRPVGMILGRMNRRKLVVGMRARPRSVVPLLPSVRLLQPSGASHPLSRILLADSRVPALCRCTRIQPDIPVHGCYPVGWELPGSRRSQIVPPLGRTPTLFGGQPSHRTTSGQGRAVAMIPIRSEGAVQ